MNYNSIQARLTMAFAALNGRFDENISKHENWQEWPDGKGVSLTFDKEDKHIVFNKIMTILHSLGSLKDHLKNCLKKNDHNPQIVEDEINGSLHLQVLIDLVNKDKHGSELNKPRSGRDPWIDDPRNGLRMGSKKGSPLEEGSPDQPTMFIDAYIMDGEGKLLFYLDELVETCFLKWRELAATYGCS